MHKLFRLLARLRPTEDAKFAARLSALCSTPQSGSEHGHISPFRAARA
ncbi:hypothetical protein SAMN05877831_101567 [Rhodobacter maris]|uniref:Uncharacterized protein n=1 Tax=Rhodobacter maris TaxID=446682 RepID=A0A285RKM0_9RHOB|nr:hypothetical protein SAMN05877831_101567 [Rhodobacter maris]